MNYSIKELEAVEFEVNSLYAALMSVQDKRKARGKRYSLATLLTLSVLAKLGGEDTPEGMAEWVKHRAEQLRTSLGIHRQRMPHAVTYRRVLGTAFDIQELEQVLGAFFERCVKQHEQLAMDGKSLRGTIETGATRGLHLLAVYAVGTGVVLKQINVLSKENEISAAPRVLSGLPIKGKVVTGDAIFTHRDLSGQIVEMGGHYLWKVKDNQPSLRADIERLFGPEHVPLGSAPLKTDFQVVTTTRKVSGRVETHTLTTSTLLNTATDWPGLAQVGQLVRDVQFVGTARTTHEVSYIITSLPPQDAPPSRLLNLSRRHWAIENKLHYCRDVTFHEDRCRLTGPQTAQAIALLNNLVLGLLHVRRFLSIASARRRYNACPAEALALVLYSFI